MLERIGFQYVNRIDCSTAGRTTRLGLEDVTLVRAYRRAKLAAEPLERGGEERLVGLHRTEGRIRFRAVRAPVRLDDDEVRVPANARAILGAEPGERLHLVPFE